MGMYNAHITDTQFTYGILKHIAEIINAVCDLSGMQRNLGAKYQIGREGIHGSNPVQLGRPEAPADYSQHQDYDADSQSQRYIQVRSLLFCNYSVSFSWQA